MILGMRTITADEAVEVIEHGDTIGIGGFTSAGAPRTLAKALLNKARAAHEKGEPFKVNLITGASTLDEFDGGLAECDALGFRMPYQSNAVLRNAINQDQVRYWDCHLSQVSPLLLQGLLGPVGCALIEVSEITDDGKCILTTGVGITPTLCRVAKKIIIEVNPFYSASLKGLHDLYEVALPPDTQPIPLTCVDQKIGLPYLQIDPEKIVGVVEATEPIAYSALAPSTSVTDQIGKNIIRFLGQEIQSGRLSLPLPPLQIGVGNIANAVLERLLQNEELGTYTMYSEILQDNALRGILSGKISHVSGCALAITEECAREINANWEMVKQRVTLRSQEITNHPEIIRRLGVISINTALEADLWGNVNSTHICGQRVVNGIGGSEDFAAHAQLSIFATPSVAKGGAISAIVPLCSHIDHTEHNVQVLVTEWGVADLRGRTPSERAKLVINRCAHPAYREALSNCLLKTPAHIPLDLAKAFRFHEQFLEQGTMQQ